MFRCSGDNTIGPVLTSAFVNPNCYDFDFTLVFEDSLFSIIPCGIVLLVTAWRLHTLVRRDTIVRWPLLRALKLVSPLELTSSLPLNGPCVIFGCTVLVTVCLFVSVDTYFDVLGYFRYSSRPPAVSSGPGGLWTWNRHAYYRGCQRRGPGVHGGPTHSRRLRALPYYKALGHHPVIPSSHDPS